MKVLLTSWLLGTCLAQSVQKPIIAKKDNPLTEDFAKYVHSILDHFHVPALSIAVIHNNTVFSQGYGTAIFPDVSAKPETLYYTGSTTKSFTAAALTLLMDDLKNTSSSFDWQTPVVDLIREDFVLQDEYITTHATLEDLASHRTGLPRHDNSYGSNGTRTVRDTVRNMRNLPMTKGFREEFQYCNYMWATLGYIVELLSGKNEGHFLRERLWSKLGMHSTFWTLEEARAAEKDAGQKLAQGYTWDTASQKYYEDPYINIVPLAGAGAMISSVLDYAEYLKVMIHRSGPLSEDAHVNLRRARMFEVPDVKAPWAGPVAYTLGWDIKPYQGVNIRSHNGGLYGFGALMAYVPEMEYAVAMLGNTAGTSNYAEEVIHFRLLDDLLGVSEDKRFDWVKHYDDLMKKSTAKDKTSRERLYGDVKAEDRKPTSLPFEAYAGSYWSAGYKMLTLDISAPSEAIPGLNKTTTKDILFGDWSDRTWPSYWQLEHITGEHFVAWLLTEKGTGADKLTSVSSGEAAEFRIGADGRPSEVGIAVEESMGGKKMWFKRV